jgi:hypothetical protein
MARRILNRWMSGVTASVALAIQSAAPAFADNITIEATGQVLTNEIVSGEPLSLVNPGETATLTLQVESNNWNSFYPDLYRAYLASALDLTFSGGVQIDLLPGEAAYIAVADNLYFGGDSFWLSNYFFAEPGKVQLAQQPYLFDFQLGYDGATINSVNILDALGSYDADAADLSGFRVWDSYANNPANLLMNVEFEQMTITIGSADGTQIRVIHLSPDAPAVDLLVDGSLRPVTNLIFTDSTGYLDIDPGTVTFDVVPTGGSIGDSVLTIPLTLAPDTFYTAVAYGELFGLSEAISAMALEDDSSAPAAGTARLRAVHTAVGFGEVDILDVPTFGPLVPLWQDLGFGVAGEPLEVSAFPRTVGIDTDNDLVPEALFQVPLLAAGASANIFAVTDAGDNLFLLVQLRDGTTLRLDPVLFAESFEDGTFGGWSTSSP